MRASDGRGYRWPSPKLRRETMRARLLLISIMVAAVLPIGTSASAQKTGCAKGFQTLSVAELTEQGYILPGTTDDPANGGNGNGLICGRPIGYRDPSDPTRQIYIFADDRV
jgi:hypothetical protein